MMAYPGEFVVDWFMSSDNLHSNAAVAVFQGSKGLGIYQVKQIGVRSMTLSQGDIAFPVGTALEIEDFQKLMPGAPSSLPTRVMQNDEVGIHLVWDEFYDLGTA
jgi:hypothetical protein